MLVVVAKVMGVEGGDGHHQSSSMKNRIGCTLLALYLMACYCTKVLKLGHEMISSHSWNKSVPFGR
jgi:hypothetical protein